MKFFWIIFFFLIFYPPPAGSVIYHNHQTARNNIAPANIPDISVPVDIRNNQCTGLTEDVFSDTRLYRVPQAFIEYPYCCQYKQLSEEGILYNYPHCFNKTIDPLRELDMPPPLAV